MSFFFRKTIRLGPLNLNLSKRGLGLSAGVKGCRIGAGSRGVYVAGGGDGVYFRKYLTALMRAKE